HLQRRRHHRDGGAALEQQRQVRRRAQGDQGGEHRHQPRHEPLPRPVPTELIEYTRDVHVHRDGHHVCRDPGVVQPGRHPARRGPGVTRQPRRPFPNESHPQRPPFLCPVCFDDTVPAPADRCPTLPLFRRPGPLACAVCPLPSVFLNLDSAIRDSSPPFPPPPSPPMPLPHPRPS